MTTINPKLDINHADRLGLTIFLALSFHALIILGISFHSDDPVNPPEIINTLDVTLVHTKTDELPEDPDYLAQVNQSGGGNTDEKVKVRNPKQVASAAEEAGTGMTNRPHTDPDPNKQGNRNVLTSESAELKVSSVVETPKADDAEQASVAQIVERSRMIARLSAQHEASWQAYSKRPDPKYLYANTRKHTDAAYLTAWSQKVERIGNLNYPDEARRNKLSGSLIMEVSIQPDGTLMGIKLLRSSGHKILDDAAVRIVRLAAPFAKVPEDVLGKRNELRIVRAWLFTVQNRLVSK